MERSEFGNSKLVELKDGIVEVIKEIPITCDFPDNPFFLNEVRACYRSLGEIDGKMKKENLEEGDFFHWLATIGKTLLVSIHNCNSSDPDMEKSREKIRIVLVSLEDCRPSSSLLVPDEMVA